MNWIDFKAHFFNLACFSIHEVYAWMPDFDRNNFVRWTRKGYLIRLRRGLYSFPECLDISEMALYFAGKIYRPSYISLHSALSYYGLIPESVVQITSVTSLKTASFKNRFGDYSYKTIRSDLMFGYEKRQFADGRPTAIAVREKAILDLFYLYPFYDTETEIAELRLDRDTLVSDFDRTAWNTYIGRFKSKALEKRSRLVEKVYAL